MLGAGSYGDGKENGTLKALKTGDLGRITREGLEILGRSDLKAKVNGMRLAAP